MNATGLKLQPEIALRAITMDKSRTLLLPSGNNYRVRPRLFLPLPGNGGLSPAVSDDVCRWDGCSGQ